MLLFIINNNIIFNSTINNTVIMPWLGKPGKPANQQTKTCWQKLLQAAKKRKKTAVNTVN